MSRKWIMFCTIILLVHLMSFGWVSAATAQDENPPPDSACRTCHEEQYWLYDTGKWYCLCGKQRACIDCHGGDATQWDVDLAHEGVVKNPIAENSAVCQECHPDDYQAHIEKFAAVAGIDPNAVPEPTRTPYAAAVSVSAGVPVSSALQVQPPGTGEMAAFGLLGLLFVVLILFGYRCWKADCMAKTIHL